MHPPRVVRSSASGPHFDAPILVAGACVERRLSSRTFLARSLYPSRMHSASASRPSKCPFAFPIFTSSLLLWCHIMLRILFFALLLIVLAFRTVRRNCGFQPSSSSRSHSWLSVSLLLIRLAFLYRFLLQRFGHVGMQSFFSINDFFCPCSASASFSARFRPESLKK